MSSEEVKKMIDKLTEEFDNFKNTILRSRESLFQQLQML